MQRLRLWKRVSFSLMGILVGILISGTVVEQQAGSETAMRYCYAAPWTIALWCAAVLSGGTYIVGYMRHRKTHSPLERVRQGAVFGIHLSFTVILAGAMCTHLWSENGSVHLRIGETDTIADYTITLDDFDILYYAGTSTAEDYVSHVRIQHNAHETAVGHIAMNHVFRHRGWRFYQASYDGDKKDVVLLYTHDPLGIAVTYAGYALLFISMLIYLFTLFFYPSRNYANAL